MSNESTGGTGHKLIADVGEMMAASGQIATSREALGTILGQLRTIVDGSQNVWASDAGTQFVNVMADWDRSSKNLNDALDEISQGIRTNGHSYDEMVDEQARAITNVGSSLNGSYT